jgi:Na+-translocating ferredoxin:NAD+ oxidoreductase RnfG subunit
MRLSRLNAWLASSLIFLVERAVPVRADEPARPSEAEIGSIQQYLTPYQAVREIWSGVASVDTLVARLSPQEMASIKKTLGESAPSDTVVVLRPRDAQGNVLGHAVIGEEVGKYRPITFMVGTTPDLTVRNVEVLVYRESRGGEVRFPRFLRQYRGKSGQSPIRTNRDIINIAGATVSVNALNLGVKRALLSLEALRARKVL